jgi:predicted dinucleotide-binding enzyme
VALIVATAQDYAYGPAARLLTVAERLAERGHDVVVAARGASHQLAARSQLIRVECLPKGRAAAAATLRSLLADADLLVLK